MTESDPQLTHVVLFSMDGKKIASGRMTEADAGKLVANLHEKGCEDAEAHLCPGVYYGCLHCWP
ncbi:MAG TPA: hypothetical protein VF782_14355 [Allosphingosinicella sp.]|jgi:hypothetical protein